jgi:hypothetical protein
MFHMKRVDAIKAKMSAGIRSLNASISQVTWRLRFVDHYNEGRYHKSLDSPSPVDVYFGRGKAIHLERERIKLLRKRRRNSRGLRRPSVPPKGD